MQKQARYPSAQKTLASIAGTGKNTKRHKRSPSSRAWRKSLYARPLNHFSLFFFSACNKNRFCPICSRAQRLIRLYAVLACVETQVREPANSLSTAPCLRIAVSLNDLAFPFLPHSRQARNSREPPGLSVDISSRKITRRLLSTKPD